MSLELDGFEANFRCVLSLGGALPGSATTPAERGRLLSLRGELPEAIEALRRCSKDPLARAWLGEALLMSQRFAEAEKELAAAASAAPERGWTCVHRAAARAALGDGKGAAGDLLRVRAGDPALPAAKALLGLIRSQEGNWDEAAAALGEAAALAPKAAWPLVLRARVRKAANDRAACLRDLRAALALSPEGWIFAERSRVFEEMGDLDRALEDMDQALRADGPRRDHFLRRAHLQVCRRHYHLAIPDYTQALALDPSDREALAGRAMVHCIRGRTDLAVDDMRQAERLAPQDPWAALERMRVQAYSGKVEGLPAEAAALAKRHPSAAPQAAFVSGCALLKARRYEESAAAFAKARPRDGSDFDKKAAFHLVVAAGLAAEPPSKPPLRPGRPFLYICGLGMKPPYTASLETLRAIASCDFIFNNLSEPEIGALLWLLADECEPTMYDIRGADARWTKKVFKPIVPGRVVGFVTRGHPLVCGGLASSLIDECRRVGADWEVVGSVSSMNALEIQHLPGASAGFSGGQVLDYSSFFSPAFRMDVRNPAVVYFNASALVLEKAHFDRFCGVLEKTYAPGHPVYFWGRTFAAAPDLIKVRDLRQFHGKIDASYTLLLPPKKK